MGRVFAIALSLAPALALACPVCGQGKEGSGPALLVMSIIMTLLPLCLVGGTVVWISIRVKKAEREQPESK